MVKIWLHKWRLVSIMGVLAMITYLVIDGRNETARIDDRVDRVREPVCAVMYSSLNRPPIDNNPETLQARQDYIKAYGPDGLRCTNGPVLGGR